FGWQRPCYLVGEGYTKTFKELMETTDWDKYGTGNYEKCADCRVHSCYEATAVMDATKHPLKALAVALRGVKTDGEMAPEIPLDKQRPAEYVFSRHVETALEQIKNQKVTTEAAERSAAIANGGIRWNGWFPRLSPPRRSAFSAATHRPPRM